MEVSCPACAARYTADDEKLRGKTARMRCKACNTVWVVSGASEASPMPHAPIENESSAKHAAVLKKGTDREQRDLFAERESEGGSIRSFPPPPSVGARNENSVLFRVDQLTSAGHVKTPAPASALEAPGGGPVVLGGDDEGVIDLKALSSTARRNVAAPLAPLFSEPPPVAVDVDDGVQGAFGKFTNKKRLFVGAAAAAAVLLLAGIGISVAFKGEEPVQRAATVVTPPPAETVTPPPPAPEPAPLVASAATADDTKDAKAAPAETKGKKGKGGRGKATKSVATATKATAAAKPAPKAADPCGCKGDFNCMIACSAKGHR
ncbi:MAG TPA: zinc-ribbon domain-containing protein [Labilithrix sp.]|nr:zinc-ribbon domain-containing protein [Labilithrix sp.]